MRALLDLSYSTHWRKRVDAAEKLGEMVDEPVARARLTELLHDAGDVAVQTAAAGALTKRGGVAGLLAVLEEIGRRSDDADVDYIAYQLYGMEGTGEYPVLDIASEIASETMTAHARIGLASIERLLGRD
ncbi:hypothetical protein C8258_18245 [Nocardia sp. MDA0666]|uniref:HEAT repeat domain-containing protein n=1 Tax=Nocardia sp. MDA0666 TaxID=2135448 RepID=UPI000D481C10|nr:HEAT repeat domain-containing protein [Nocardia sp. MDA0666]PSR66823.1 hypothetical protein C8258_18245 [Nocardia sp. MDA0666]